jgi:hypothetical protein
LTAESKGTVESLFRWMTQRIERRLPNTSYGVHDANTAAQAGGMTLEELERCFIQAVVDDYQQAWDPLRRQRRTVLWEQAVAQSGVPQYLGSPDDLKLLLMKAINRKTPNQRTRTLSPRNGVLRFPSHDKRKMRTRAPTDDGLCVKRPGK